MRCLVVDDSPTMRRILVNALKTIGIGDLVEAGDGKEALAALGAGGIDLVITDWNMPVMGGLDFVKSVRGAPATAALPILMVTTRSAKEDILQAVEAGVNSYVLKPFTPPVLRDKIESVMPGATAA
jgi:two-component system chemotaxis response regulator CheY